ncbi:MAG TPA: response regulator [Bacteroidia bacterium]|nr:response regulator [Bacteroidia bacterium]
MDYFDNPEAALKYLKETKDDIFLIISDMAMPKMNGLDFKKAIDNDEVLQKKSIPFIFTTNDATKEQINEAYEYRAQGYFKKAATLEEQAEMLNTIIKYWINSRHPNKNKIPPSADK